MQFIGRERYTERRLVMGKRNRERLERIKKGEELSIREQNEEWARRVQVKARELVFFDNKLADKTPDEVSTEIMPRLIVEAAVIVARETNFTHTFRVEDVFSDKNTLRRYTAQ